MAKPKSKAPRKRTGKYCMYLRKSRADMEAEALGEYETLARHERILTKLAEKNGLVVTKVFKELVSGDSIASRPEMKKLLKSIKACEWDGVLVVEVERLARGDTSDQGTVAKALQRSSTKIITPVKTYDPDDENDMEYLEFGLFMSRREYKTIRRRLVQGTQNALEEGRFLGSKSAFGYDRRKIDGKWTLVPNDDAKYVRMMFEMAADGDSSLIIAKRLDALGVKTAGGAKKWDRAVVQRMLKNEVYIGKIRWGESRVVYEEDENGEERIHHRHFSEYELYEGLHDGIVSVGLFERTQAEIKNRIPKNFSTDAVGLYAGILRCGKCKRAMNTANVRSAKLPDGTHSKRRRYVHNRKFTECKVKSILVEPLNEAICFALEQSIAECRFLLEDDSGAERRAHEGLIASLRAQLEKIESSADQLFDLLDEGTITKSEFVRRKQVLNDRKDATLNELAEQELIRIPDRKAEMETMKRIIEVVKDESADTVERNRLLRTMIDHIDYWNDRPSYYEDKVRLDIHLR